MKPQEIISKRRRDYENVSAVDGDSGYLRMLSNAVERLSIDLYDKETHFLLELIQNAEDNKYGESIPPEVFMVLTDDDPTESGADGCFCLFNNELGFEKENIDSICSVGASTKKKKDGYVGEKGIGFKSVFTVTAEPHLFSNGYQIKFKEKDEEAKLSYILPYWVDNLPTIVQQKKMTTSLLLPLKHGQKEKIIRDLARIQPETILFLTTLESLNIEIESTQQSIVLVRDHSGDPYVDLLIKEGEEDEKLDNYYLFKKSIAVPPDLNEPKREDVVDRELTLAFPLNDERRSTGTVFAYLPTEVESGFPFLVNADFLLTANRGSIHVDCSWNDWIRGSLTSVIVEAIEKIATVEKHQEIVCGYIPVPGDHGVHHEYFQLVAEEVCDLLSEKAIVLNDHGEMVVPSRTLLVSNEERKLFPVMDRPEFFDDLSFVDSSQGKYSQQLRSIGVGKFTIPQFMQCLSSDRWITSREIEWFVELFRYLSKKLERKYGNDIPSETKLIPLYGGGIASLNEQVYLQSDRKMLDELQKITEQVIAPVKLFSNKLYRLLENDKPLMLWVQEALELEGFSLDHYVREELVPWLYENEGQYSSNKLIEISEFLVVHWLSFTEETLEVIGGQLPLVLSDKSIVCRHEIGEQQLLTPKSHDTETGWQLFLEDEEIQHCSILSNHYHKEIGIHDCYQQFLEMIDASSVPELKSVTFNWADRRDEGHDSHLREYLHGNMKESTRLSESFIKTWMPPAFSLEGKTHRKSKTRDAFVHWLNAVIDRKTRPFYAPSALNAHSYHLSYKAYNKPIKSYFLVFLSRSEWIRTTRGHNRPGEVFLDTEATRSIFHDRLPYLKDQLSDALINELGINREVTEESVIDYLVELSGQQEVDKKLIEKIYHYLDQNGEKNNYLASFQQQKLIYIPKNKQGWYSLSEVVWEDSSEALGTLFGWLSPIYDSKGLRGFFVSKLGVAISPDAKGYADAWLALPQRTPFPEPETIKIAIDQILRKVLSVLKSSDERPSWWSKFLQSDRLQVWTQNNQFDNVANVYALDNQTYARIFSDSDMEYFWKPEDITHATLSPLYHEIGVHLLSDVISIRPATTSGKTKLDSGEILSDISKVLIVRMLYNTDQDHCKSLLDDGRFEVFMRIQEWSVSQLDLVYKNDFGEEREEKNQASYLDINSRELLISSAVDRDDILDVVSRYLARYFSSTHQYKQYQDTIRKCLGVNEERATTIRRNEGWSLPKEWKEQLKSYLLLPLEDEFEVIKKAIKTDSETDSTQSSGEGHQQRTASVSSGHAETKEQDKTLSSSSAHVDKHHHESGPRRSGAEHTAKADHQTTNARSGQHSNQRSTERKSRSRSQDLNRKITSFSQRRVPIYLEAEKSPSESDKERSEDEKRENKRIGALAEQYVISVLTEAGLDVQDMNDIQENHPGYDLRVTNRDTGEISFIEVKGTKGVWGQAGVGLSVSQFKEGSAQGSSYWLYVVENVGSDTLRISRIQDPFGKANRYYFSGDWRQLSQESESSEKVEKSLDELVAELKEVADEAGVLIIDHCHQQGWPLPEVGFELLNEMDAVVGEYELAWNELKLGLYYGDLVDDRVEEWTLIPMKKVSSSPELLEDYLNAGIEGE